MLKPRVTANVFTETKLLSLYARDGKLEEARQVFDKMSEPNEVSWTALITGYIKHKNYEQGMDLYTKMHRSGIILDTHVFPSVLKACASTQNLKIGQQTHAHLIKAGFNDYITITTSLVDMYSKCKKVDYAFDVFGSMKVRNPVSWNAMIGGYVHNRYYEEALKMFMDMIRDGKNPCPTNVTLVLVISACASIGELQRGKEIHCYLLRSGLQSDIYLDSALVDMYAKCQTLDSAKKMFYKMGFKNIITWNSMIVGCAQNGLLNEALELFMRMKNQGLRPDLVTWTAIVAGYAQVGNMQMALRLIREMQEKQIKLNVISWTAIISGFAESGRCNHALECLAQMQVHGLKPDLVSWNAMLSGYVQNKKWNKALKLFHQMQRAGAKPNSITVVTVLTACANLSALKQGQEIHKHVVLDGYDQIHFIGSSLLDMYAKCGCIEYARDVFDRIPQKNLVLWNALIAAYATHGLAETSLGLFQEMQEQGLQPDHITFTSILSACSHKGLVNEGIQYFQNMVMDYKIAPTMEHCSCMVDLYGRSGSLDKAWKLVSEMPFEPDVSVLAALLGACRIHQNVKLAETVGERLIRIDPENANTYVLLSNIYAAAGRKEDVVRMRRILKTKNLRKSPGCSWIQVGDVVHSFVVADKCHRQSKEIYRLLEKLALEMKAAGYVPNTSFVLYDLV